LHANLRGETLPSPEALGTTEGEGVPPLQQRCNPATPGPKVATNPHYKREFRLEGVANCRRNSGSTVSQPLFAYLRPSHRRSRLQWLTPPTALQPGSLSATPMGHRARHHFNKSCTVALPLLCNSATLPERKGRPQSLFTPQHLASRAENQEIQPIRPQTLTTVALLHSKMGGGTPLPLEKIDERGRGTPLPSETDATVQHLGDNGVERFTICSEIGDL
jgi:hypothetical protein